MSKNILITGATGFIGSHLVKANLEKGYNVRAFTLPDDPGQEKLKNLGVEVIHGDIRSLSSLQRASKDINVIFHCAAVVTDWASWDKYEEITVNGAENVCKAAHENRVERLVDVSTNDVFGRIEDKVITEDFPLKKWREPYPDSKIEAEKIMWYYYNEHGVPVTMVYPCWVYGEGDRTFVPLLADAIRKKEMIFWRKNALVWPTYIENLVDIMMKIAEQPEAVGNGYLVHDGESVTLQEFCAEIAGSIDKQPPGLHIPYFLAYYTAVLMEFTWKLFRLKNRPLLTTYAVKNLGSRFRYSIDKAGKRLGWKPPVSYKEGMRKTMNWLKGQDLDQLIEK